jgi:hypothetical protein
MDQRISKWRDGHPFLRQLCPAQHFRNGCGRRTSDLANLGKVTIQNSMFNNSYSHVYQEGRHLALWGSGSHNSAFTIRIGLVTLRLHTALFLKNWISANSCIPEHRYCAAWLWGQDRRFETALLNMRQLEVEESEWSKKPYSYPSNDQHISYSEHDVSESDMSPSVREMHNEISMSVVATAGHGLDLVYSVRKTKPL